MKDEQKQEEEHKLEHDVAKQLVQLRKTLGISQKELADKLNTKQSAISRIEKGEQNISIGLLEKIAAALGVEVNVSLNFTQPPVQSPSSQQQPGGTVNQVGGMNRNNVY